MCIARFMSDCVYLHLPDNIEATTDIYQSQCFYCLVNRQNVQKIGCNRMWLVTTNDNTPAIRFYQRYGFTLKAVHINAVDIVIDSALAAIAAAIVLGLINAKIKPVLQIISLPITFLTLGIFYLVVNGLLLMLVSALVSGFHVAGFGTAFFASIVLSLLNAVFIGKDVKIDNYIRKKRQL